MELWLNQSTSRVPNQDPTPGGLLATSNIFPTDCSTLRYGGSPTALRRSSSTDESRPTKTHLHPVQGVGLSDTPDRRRQDHPCANHRRVVRGGEAGPRGQWPPRQGALRPLCSAVATGYIQAMQIALIEGACAERESLGPANSVVEE